MNWLKRVALRWVLGVPKAQFGVFERGVELTGGTVEGFIVSACVHRAVLLQNEEKEIDAAVADYERENGLA